MTITSTGRASGLNRFRITAKGRRTAHYREYFVPGEPDELGIVHRLVRSGLFDSHVTYRRDGECWFAGGVVAEVTVDPRSVRSAQPGGLSSAPLGGHPFHQVGHLLDCLDIERWRAYGYIAFEMAYTVGGLRRVEAPQPLLHLIVPETEVRITSDGVLIRSVSTAALRQATELATDPLSVPEYAPTAVDVAVDAHDYHGGVQSIVEAIGRRRVQKVILARKVEVPFALDLFGTYATGLAQNTPARSFMVDLDGRRTVGFSPEMVLTVGSDGLVSTQPLAGTRRCDQGEEADNRLAEDLMWDAKEGYEHVISAKLAYQEMSSICRSGSVGVRDLMTVKRRGPVQHLASQVTGWLAPGRTMWDAAEAVFPAVTASGIPKPQAYNFISGLEPDARGLYAGAVCAIDSYGRMDAALVLRSVFEEAGVTWLQAGAGIVGDSTPAGEFDETCNKLRSVSRCLIAASPVGAETASSRCEPAMALAG